MKKYILNILLILALVLSLASTVFAQEGVDVPPPPGHKLYLPIIGSSSSGGYGTSRPLPASVGEMQLDAMLTMDNTLDRSLWGASGYVEVVVTLAGDSVAKGIEIYGESFDQQARYYEILAQQDAFLDSIDATDAELGRAQRLINAVILDINASELEALAENPEVVAIKQVRNYEYEAVDLDTLVEDIGAADVQLMGYTGEGISIAVLDTGIDYTHIQLGGSGDPQDFIDQDETTLADGGFPNDKVVGGYDFVGSVWPTGDLAPDEDPLDKPSTVGHGTGTSAIAGGYDGVAPDADLYGVKVCSSVSRSCSGIALINGMEFALDPDGDGVLTDAVDIISMSLGSLYGNSYYDDLSLAVNQASMIGVLTAAAAGNAGNKPYISDTPGSAATSISVAATHTPDHIIGLMEVTAPVEITGLYPAIWQSWSGDPYLVEAPVVYAGDIDPANATGCDPFPAGTFTDVIALVDRGGCTFTSKILNVEAGDALVGIIGLVAPGDPFDGGFGGEGYPTIPGYMINAADSNTLKSGLPDTVVKFDPAVGVSQAGTMESYSGRGPSPWLNYIKPEIAAYADILTAEWGTGTGVHSFGGTSSSTPVIAGSAALLKQKLLESGEISAKHPDMPFILKSMLVNSGDTELRTDPLDFFGGELAPISRIGGGEVQVDNAAMSPITLWEEGVVGMRLPTLSFGQQDVTGVTTLTKLISVHNWTDQALVYDLSTTFRYAGDDDGAVTLIVEPTELVVAPMMYGKAAEAQFLVTMVIDGALLGDWSMNSGSRGANPDVLTANEVDGYLWLDNVATTDDDDAMIHMPWMVLPRKADWVTADPMALFFTDDIAFVDFTNTGVQEADIWPYAWLANSPQDPPLGGMGDNIMQVDVKDVGMMTYPVPAGFCSGEASFVLEFAITTYDRTTLPMGTPMFDILLDVDQDGEYDYDIFNFDLSLSGSLSDGRSVTWVADMETGDATAFFFLVHPTNSANYVLTLCGEQIGMNAEDFFAPMDALLLATDWYYSGLTTDVVDMGTIAPLGERYLPIGDPVAPGTTESWYVIDFGPVGTNPGELGAMFLLGDAPADNENMSLPVAP